MSMSRECTYVLAYVVVYMSSLMLIVFAQKCIKRKTLTPCIVGFIMFFYFYFFLDEQTILSDALNLNVIVFNFWLTRLVYGVV